MLDMVLNFVREQSVFVLLGVILAGGLISQLFASRRYRRLRRGMESLAALGSSADRQAMREAVGLKQRRAAETVAENHRGQERYEPQESTVPRKPQEAHDKMHDAQESARGETESAKSCLEAGEPDSELLYLKQSLDRIAAGRDQRYEEEGAHRRKLTPDEEKIIVDILKEYLS